MSSLNIIPNDWAIALGWTALHTLWQIAVLAVVVLIALQALHKRSARVKYGLLAISLFSIPFIAVATLIYELTLIAAQQDYEALMSFSFVIEPVQQEGWQGVVQTLEASMPMAGTAWLIGVTLLSLWFFVRLWYVQRLRWGGFQAMDEAWLNRMESWKQKLKIKQSIRWVESTRVHIPIVIGHLKPMILFPIGAVNGLTVEEVEAILVHELAHIYRKDYLVNLLQSSIEILFFYHPLVWWISSRIRTEREHCCDDLVVALQGDKLGYAKSLARLQEMTSSTPVFALSVMGPKDQLLTRIQRLFGEKKPEHMKRPGASALIILVVALLTISISLQRNEVEAEPIDIDYPVDIESGDTNRVDSTQQVRVKDAGLEKIIEETEKERQALRQQAAELKLITLDERQKIEKFALESRLQQLELSQEIDKLKTSKLNQEQEKQLTEKAEQLKQLKIDQKKAETSMELELLEIKHAYERIKLKERELAHIVRQYERADVAYQRQQIRTERDSIRLEKVQQRLARRDTNPPPPPPPYDSEQNEEQLDSPPPPPPPGTLYRKGEDGKFYPIVMPEGVETLAHHQAQMEKLTQQLQHINQSNKKVQKQYNRALKQQKATLKRQQKAQEQLAKHQEELGHAANSQLEFIDVLKKELVKDGVLKTGDQLKTFSLSKVGVYVNDVKQSNSLHEKYKTLLIEYNPKLEERLKNGIIEVKTD